MNVVYVIAQVFSSLHLCLSIISQWQKNKKKLLMYNMIGNILNAIHLGLLSAWTGAGAAIISAGRAYVFSLKGKARLLSTIFTPLVFLAITIVMCCITWAGYLSLIPVAATSIFLFATWFCESKWIRILTLFNLSLWIVYYSVIPIISVMGIITCAVSLVFTGLALVKLDILSKKQEKKDLIEEVENPV